MWTQYEIVLQNDVLIGDGGKEKKLIFDRFDPWELVKIKHFRIKFECHKNLYSIEKKNHNLYL